MAEIHLPDAAPRTSSSSRWRRLALPAVLLAVAAAVYFSGAHRWLSFATLKEHRAFLQAMVESNGVLAAVGFIGVYAAAVALSVPGAVILTVTGGFLFGSLLGTALAVTGATLGAMVFYLAARTVLAGFLEARAGGAVRRLEAGFRENALSYLLVLRLVPLFPFWLVNLAAAVLRVPWPTYLVGTFAGIIPGAFVYAQVGAGIGSVLDRGGEPSLAGALTPQVLLALLGLAVLSLVPVACKRVRAGRR